MKLRLGSRGSPLAVTQTQWVAQELKKHHSALDIEFVQVTTRGDQESQASLKEIGGKGVFVKELEEALLKREIDVAVHSLKDVPEALPSGLRLGPFPLREDPRDALISRFGEQLHELQRHSIIGTSSPRRQAQILHRYRKREYRFEPIRGNIETRLRKLEEGRYDAIILAVAGLKRLHLESDITQILEPAEMMPAPGQGCLALELRDEDNSIASLLETIRHQPSDITARTERAFLSGLGGDCNIPVGALASIVNDKIHMEALLHDAKGEKVVRSREEGPPSQPEYVGAVLAERLLYEGGAEILLAENVQR